MLLVGQAPGPIERDVARPFAGRAGRQLMRWMVRAGFRDEEDFRARVYMTSVTTCFPGRRPDGSGDRRPSAREVALCAPWLDGVLELLEPRLVITAGSLALSRLVPSPRRLEELVGGALLADGRDAPPDLASVPRVLVPLPHPSGQSRWLNDPARAALLDAALRRLRTLTAWAEEARATV
jgi:uracil-DNA glycosylase